MAWAVQRLPIELRGDHAEPTPGDYRAILDNVGKPRDELSKITEGVAAYLVYSLTDEIKVHETANRLTMLYDKAAVNKTVDKTLPDRNFEHEHVDPFAAAFLISLEHVTDKNTALRLAENVRRARRITLNHGPNTFSPLNSVGPARLKLIDNDTQQG